MEKTNFSLTQLEYVLAVNKRGHFAKAAEACHVTQPTLSMQIQKLEADLGITIFDRSKKPIVLTEIGRKLIIQMQTVLLEAKKIEVIASQRERTSGSLSLGIIPTIAPYLLPHLLPNLESKYPKLELQITEMQTQRIIEALESDEIDAGLLATPLKLQKIIERPLYYEPFYVFCNQHHPLSALKKIKYSELKQSDIWLLTEGHCLRHQVLDVCSIRNDKRVKNKYRFESGSLETLKGLVRSYGGYTLLPHLATENLGERIHLIPFERPIPAREVGLVYQRRQYKTELIESLAEVISLTLPAEIRKLRPKDLDVLEIQ